MVAVSGVDPWDNATLTSLPAQELSAEFSHKKGKIYIDDRVNEDFGSRISPSSHAPAMTHLETFSSPKGLSPSHSDASADLTPHSHQITGEITQPESSSSDKLSSVRAFSHIDFQLVNGNRHDREREIKRKNQKQRMTKTRRVKKRDEIDDIFGF
ncbi:hypothetical protein K439DRAFT_98732 [Ramaria rubella]|nr:hypothetical protein K439DRAFT_98732 [Ramaria rubella]